MNHSATELVLLLVGAAALLGVIANGALFWAVRRLVGAVEALVKLVTEVHRESVVGQTKLAGRVALVEQKVEHLEGIGGGDGD